MKATWKCHAVSSKGLKTSSFYNNLKNFNQMEQNGHEYFNLMNELLLLAFFAVNRNITNSFSN